LAAPSPLNQPLEDPTQSSLSTARSPLPASTPATGEREEKGAEA
jgi:hypothetical protein